IPVFVGAGLRAERAGSTHAQTCPYAPFRTASVNVHPVDGQGRALPLRPDRGVLCRSNPVIFKRGIVPPPAGARNDSPEASPRGCASTLHPPE
ncbi:MAG TPA: hypothetical protein PKN11_07720, partial [Anaerolineaceae bacterium]|nr:hypothetical protein [Anaerolineaceae bacterium]